MNVALIHDWLNQRGGAEDVLETLTGLYPQAPVYTSLYWAEKMPARWREWEIHTSFIDRLPFARRRQQLYLPFYPQAFEQFDLHSFDLVISNKSGLCHGVITGANTLHVCYCLTPTRFLWRYHQYAEQEGIGPFVRRGLAPFLTYLRMWDQLAAARVDHFIAISQVVRQRIARYYGRDSVIIYPPVDTDRFTPSATIDDYYLTVGRLVPYRRLDLLIEAFNNLELPLLIAGQGRDRDRLEAMAGPNITFLGYVPEEELPELMARCRAFMWPGEEDFGIAPIQAMAAGRPVIAYAAGGALDTVVPGAGILFAEQSVPAMMAAVEQFRPEEVDTAFVREHAMNFDAKLFKQRLSAFVDEKLSEAGLC